MRDFDPDIDAALFSDGPISREKVILWIENAVDLSTLAKLYRLTGEGYYRIQPDLGQEKTCSLIQSYLLGCIEQNVTGHREIQGRWEAAQILHGWFSRLVEMENTSEVLRSAAQAITALFLKSEKEVRDAIEAGFLEHALETPALRPYFEHWASDVRLQKAWNRALAWGKAHPNFTRGLLQQLQKKPPG